MYRLRIYMYIKNDRETRSGRKSQQRLETIKRSFQLYLYFRFYESSGGNSARETFRFLIGIFFLPNRNRAEENILL